jgi:hypothetical protein
MDFNKRKKEDTVEHIYPQTPKDRRWREAFRGFRKKKRKILLNNLGNLLLLARTKNSELQNNCFEYKQRHSNKNGDEVGYYNGSYSEIEVSKEKNWTPDEIIKRGLRLLTFLEDRWNIDFKEWDVSKEDLLHLEFINDLKN